MAGFRLGFWLDSAGFGFRLSFARILLGVGSIWLDFGWIWLGFGLIPDGFGLISA